MITWLRKSRWMRWLFLLLFLLVGKLLFWPRSYPSIKSDETVNRSHWQLSTGSSIGYSFYKGDTAAKKQTPIIYLNGGPGGSTSPRVMQLLQPVTKLGFDLYFYDQVGSGTSGRLENIEEYTVDRHIKDLLAIIEKTGASQVILVGQSWGAILATHFLAAHPDKVAKLILTSPGPLYPIDPVLFRSVAPDSLQLRSPMTSNQVATASVSNLRMKLVQYWATHLGQKIASDREADAYASYVSAQTDRSTTCDSAVQFPARGRNGYYAGMMTFNDLLKTADPRAGLRKLPLSVLVLRGQCDNQPWGAAYEYTKLFSNSRLILIPDAGHFIHVEQPEAFVRHIRQFLME